MTTQQHRLAFERRLKDGRDKQAEQEQLELQEELRVARGRRESLVRDLQDEEAYCRQLEQQLGIPPPCRLDELPRDVLWSIIHSLRPVQSLALCKSNRQLYRMLHASVIRVMRRHYNLSDHSRLDVREPLGDPVWVAFTLKSKVTVPSPYTRPLPQRELYCLRCRQMGHEIPQCRMPCRTCGLYGHPESRCSGRARSRV